MNLTPEQVAAAEAAGCRFLPVPDHATHRYAMQRKVFRHGGRDVLATRGGGLYETIATLERLIEEGRAVLAARRRVTEAEAPPPAEPVPPPPPGSPRLRRTRLAAPPSLPPMAPSPSPPPVPHAAEATEARTSPAVTGLAPPRRSQQPRSPRWMTAGAERRGRAGVHWSTRMR